MKLLKQVSVLALFSCAQAAFSQESKSTQIVITPYRSEAPVEQVGNSLSVITREEIERKKQNSVIDVLRTAPGLSVVQAGGAGRASSVFIRGADSDHTLVLIDGIRANDNNVGAFDFADLKTENIERIEIIRGAQSVLYGSEAIGGVINIITRSAEEGTNVSARAEGGSYSTHTERASLNYGSENIKQNLSLSYLDTDGISAANSSRGNPEDDAYESLTFSSNTTAEFLDDGKANLSLRYGDHETEADGFDFVLGAVDDPNFTQDRDTLSLAANISKPINEQITPSLEIGTYREDLEGSDPDSEFNNYDIENRTLSLTPKVDFEFNEAHTTTLGYTFEDREGEHKGAFDEEREVNSYFLQHLYSYDDQLFLTGGIREDDDSEFGEETTYRVTLAKLFRESDTRLHSSIATGFKAPSFNELFFPFFGNPELDPETSKGYDVGVEQSFLDNKAVLDVTFFQNEFDDLISFDVATFQAANIAKSNAYGFETSLLLELTSYLDLNSNYTYTESEDESTGKILPRRPRHQASFDLNMNPTEEIQGILSLLLVNSRRESTGEKMDNYEKVDFTVNYKLSDMLTPYIRFENLFDEDYEEIVGFGTSGFSVYAGLEVKL